MLCERDNFLVLEGLRTRVDAYESGTQMINLANPETDGDTKPCPRCQGSLIFRPRHPILTIGVRLQLTGREVGDRIRYERGWICKTPACGYRELIAGEAVGTT